jgi:uncharacterized protein YndB with AHSA1/START domain
VRAREADPRLLRRGAACALHTFAVQTRARPELVWAALTDPDKTGRYLYGLAVHSTWTPEADIGFRRGERVELTGRVVHVRRHERLCCLLRSGPEDPPAYLTWTIRPVPGGCTIRLEIDEIDNADSCEDAEDVWLPVLAALHRLLDQGDPG